MADATAPLPAEDRKPEEVPGATEASTADSTAESNATMSGALQSPGADPDADATKAPEASEGSKVNGDTTEAVATTEEGKAEEEKPAEATKDVAMKDTASEEGAADTEAAVPADASAGANGESESVARPSSAKRKSTGGVSEPKGKKLNKKKSLAKITHLDAKPGEYYFARLKSYPPWPSVICDEEMLPVSLLTSRPVTTKQADGTYKEAYADGGKRVHERTFPIMFLYTNEFAWIPNTDLTPLNPEECKDVSQKGKSKSLIAAYEVASKSYPLDHYKEMLLQHQRAMDEDQEIRDQREAEKAAKAARTEAKKKRKSTDVAADGDVEMEDVGEDDAEAKPKSSKKRKKEADSGDEAEKPAKTPKTATKLKLTTPKAPTPSESSKKGKDSAKPAKPKTPATKKGKKEQEEEAAPTPKEPEDPAEAAEKKKKEVLYLRHKLQKCFLTREQAPKEEEMKSMSGFIRRLEEYEGLEVSIIRATKVNKVLKAILKLNTIPKDEEFNFRKRSHDLLEKWNKLFGAEAAEPGEASVPTKDEEGTTNGTNGVHKPEDKEEEAEAEPAPKVAAPIDAADVAEEKPLPESPAEAKETIVDGLVDGPASSGALAAEAEKPAEEVKNDAEETEPSTKVEEKVETSAGVETS